MSAQKPIHRLTLFKIAEDADCDRMLAHYRVLKETALKDGKPYILSIDAGKPFEDQRSQGYTVAAHSMFSCKEDMEYYDKECEAHKKLKADMAGKVGGLLMVYFEDGL